MPTTVIGPGTTAVPSKWVSQPRERKGSRCSRTTGNVLAPSVLMSISRVSGVSGLTSKIPVGRVVLLTGAPVGVVALFWLVRSETRGFT